MVIELKDLKGKAKLNGLPLYVQVQKEGSSLLNFSEVLVYWFLCGCSLWESVYSALCVPQLFLCGSCLCGSLVERVSCSSIAFCVSAGD